MDACGRDMYARSEGFQNWELAPLGMLVLAPPSPAELAPISNPRKSPALVPTATSARAGRTAGYEDARVHTAARAAMHRQRARKECAN